MPAGRSSVGALMITLVRVLSLCMPRTIWNFLIHELLQAFIANVVENFQIVAEANRSSRIVHRCSQTLGSFGCVLRFCSFPHDGEC
jgi:hypothetical protein